jgi:hypothetical protein
MKIYHTNSFQSLHLERAVDGGSATDSQKKFDLTNIPDYARFHTHKDSSEVSGSRIIQLSTTFDNLRHRPSKLVHEPSIFNIRIIVESKNELAPVTPSSSYGLCLRLTRHHLPTHSATLPLPCSPST